MKSYPSKVRHAKTTRYKMKSFYLSLYNFLFQTRQLPRIFSCFASFLSENRKEDNTLNHHDNTLNHHDNTLNHRDNSLNHHDNTLNHHDNTLNHHDNTLNNHDNTLNHQVNTLNIKSTIMSESQSVLWSRSVFGRLQPDSRLWLRVQVQQWH